LGAAVQDSGDCRERRARFDFPRLCANVADGRPRYGAYSQHHIMDRGDTRLVRFRFSTVKTGDAVMLSIEAVENLETAS
jgi:hypothetical protein